VRLYIKIAILIATIAILVGVFNVYWSGINIQRVLQHGLVTRAAAVSQEVLRENAAVLQSGQSQAATRNLQRLLNTESGVEYIYITDQTNDLVAHSFGKHMPSTLQKVNIPKNPTFSNPIIMTDSEAPMPVLHIAFPIKRPIEGLIHIGMNNQTMIEDVARLRNQEFAFLLFASIVAMVMSIVLVRHVTRPIALLTEQMRRYGRGGSVKDIEPDLGEGSYESKLLSDTFKQMLKDRDTLEQTLSRQKAEFEAMINSMGDAVVFADVNRKIRVCNPALETLFGYTNDEMIGKTTEHLYADPADYQKQGQIRYHTGEDVEKVQPYEMRYRRKNGEVFFCETRGTRVRDEKGNIIGFLALFRDLTSEKRHIQELDHFKNTLDATLDCVFMFWPDSLKFFYVNKGAIEQVGYATEELLNMTPLDIKPKYDAPGFRALLKPLADGSRKAITFETVHQHKDGHLVPVEIFLQYVAHPDEKPRYVAIVRDITERKRAEKELHERHQLLMLVINNAPLVLWALDKEAVFTLSIGKGLEKLGLEPGQVVGQSAWDIYADNEQITRDLRRSLRGESFLSESNAAGRIFEAYYSPFYDAENSLIGATGVAVDITERRQAENELRKSRDLLEERVAQRTQELAAAVKELEAFSYSVSHDLRSPLRSIDGFSHILMDDYASNLDVTALDYLKRIRSAAQRMAQLIDDLLQLSRVTRTELLHEPVNLSELAASIVQELKTTDPSRQLVVTVQPDLRVQADTNLMRILLQNLFSNAWKYTAKKAVTEITLGRLEGAGANIFYISDNGAGFDMKYASKLFGAFQRLHHDHEYEGTGIGLATVQRIIDRHGGKVWGESELGKGATFYFQLPTVSSGNKTADGDNNN